ncbi:MAG: anthranilate phosphoribosyltransferase [candidate division WOR-3 bacterium]
MIRKAISKVVQGEDLSVEEMCEVMNQIVNGAATESQVAALLTGLRMKGEKPEEIIGALNVLKEKAKRVELPYYPLIDVVGTGGDGSGTFNVSTTCALVLAGGGVKVAKHGNRALSSLCGSADVLEALGARIDLDPDGVKRLLESTGFAFLFAPFFHPALRNVQKPRQEIGIRTIFNILGPLANPASPTHMLLGVAEKGMCEIYADVLIRLGIEKAAVVHGLDGLDEISVGERTIVFEIDGRKLEKYLISPWEFGIKKAKSEDIKGGNPQENMLIVKAILEGKEKGPKRDIVVINAGFGFYLVGMTKSLQEGISYAMEIIDSGAALKVLNAYVRESQACF